MKLLILTFLLLASFCANSYAGMNPYERPRSTFTSDGQVVMGYQQNDYKAAGTYGNSYGNYGQPAQTCYGCY